MNILYEYPPNFDKIKEVFPIKEDTVFTYGDTIYSPKRQKITPDLIIHEDVHVKQQVDPELWWNKYLKDKEFRLSQELEAYRAQYKFLCGVISDRNRRGICLHTIASHLSSDMYGNIISYSDAIKAIKI